MPRLPLIGGSYTSRSVAVAAQSSINVYSERTEDPNEKDKGIGALFGCPGRHLFADLSGSGIVRGIWSGGGRLFVAVGTTYRELSDAGALIGSVRTIANDGGNSPVQFFVNGNQLFIVSAGVCYVDNGAGPTIISLPASTGTVTTSGVIVIWVSGDKFRPDMVAQPITINAVVYTVNVWVSDELLLLTSSAGIQLGVAYSSSPAMSALTGAFLDGYFLVNRSGSRNINISPLNDGSNEGTYAWDALDFARKESYPDYIRAIIANNEQLYVFGTETGEIWQNTGQGVGGFPFERINGASFHYGTVSSWSPIVLDGRVYFLSSNREGQVSAYVFDGFTPRRISTHAIESQWNKLIIGDVYSYSYIEEGHPFWVFHIGAQTWAYDARELSWHERYAWSGSAFTPYPTNYHTHIAEWVSPSGASGMHITGGRLDGKLFESSVNFYDDNGANIKWQRALPYIYNGGDNVYYGRMTLEVETGTIPSGAEPTISREYSDDRGHTWSTSETAGLGVNADYSKRVFWPVGGSSRNRVWRLSGVGQHKVALVDLECDLKAGVN